VAGKPSHAIIAPVCFYYSNVSLPLQGFQPHSGARDTVYPINRISIVFGKQTWHGVTLRGPYFSKNPFRVWLDTTVSSEGNATTESSGEAESSSTDQVNDWDFGGSLLLPETSKPLLTLMLVHARTH
jgi:hypothetical protein